MSSCVVGSILVGAVAMTLIAGDFFPQFVNIMIIPIIAYVVATIISVVYQYSACKKLNAGSIFIGDLGVLVINILVGVVLFVENIPIYKYVFGNYSPRNPISGLPYDPHSAEYIEGMKTETHYKPQIFSGIVKAVVPVYAPEEVKEGFVYFYWTFWATMLPLYYVMGAQGLC